MNIREGIIQALAANVELKALLEDRVWSTFMPNEGEVAGVWLVIHKIYGGEEGTNNRQGRLTHPTFQFSIGGTNKVSCDRVQELLIEFDCREFTYTEDGKDYVLTFHHQDDRDERDDKLRLYNQSVDLQVWVEIAV
jgi:hypothetical protein